MFVNLIKKELFVELRNKEVVFSMLAFGSTVLLIFSFSLIGNPKTMHEIAPGLFWTLVLLSSSLGLHRMFGIEKDFDAFSSLIGSPIDRSTLFLSKWLSGFIFLSLTELLIALPFFLFLGLSKPLLILPGVGILLIGNLGITSVGVLVSGLAMRARMSAVLLSYFIISIIDTIIDCLR